MTDSDLNSIHEAIRDLMKLNSTQHLEMSKRVSGVGERLASLEVRVERIGEIHVRVSESEDRIGKLEKSEVASVAITNWKRSSLKRTVGIATLVGVVFTALNRVFDWVGLF